MKKINIGLSFCLLILIVATSVYAVPTFSHNSKILYNSQTGDVEDYDSIANFLNLVLQKSLQGKIIYDLELNKDVVKFFSNMLSVEAVSNENFVSSASNKFIIYIGTPNSSFIDSEITDLIQDSDSVLIYEQQNNIKYFYIIVMNDTILDSLVKNLTYYYTFTELENTLAYYNLDSGFSSFDYLTCYASKERDSGWGRNQGGDYPQGAGCLNNGIDWMCDTCLDGKTLAEFYCEKVQNISMVKIYNCSSCLNGVCRQCEEKWLDQTPGRCLYSFQYRGYVVMKTYQYETSNGKCGTKNAYYKKCNGRCNVGGTDCTGTLLPAPTSIITGQVVSEESSNFNIFSRIADFFRNLF